MADMIASAVVVPELDPGSVTAQSPPLKKRRQSSHSSISSASKRPRLDENIAAANANAHQTNGVSSTVSPPPATAQAPESDRRKSATNVSERQRTRRLFGALLGPAAKPAPSKNASNSAQQRRLETEKKQAARQAELAVQAEEDARVLLARRKVEQKLWDEEGKRLQWNAERYRAEFLRTSSDGEDAMLYWQPWDMTEAQKATVAEQIKAVEVKIASEGGNVQHMSTADDQHAKTTDGKSMPLHDGQVDGSAPQVKNDTETETGAKVTSEDKVMNGTVGDHNTTTMTNGTSKGEDAATEPPDLPVEKEVIEDLEGEEADVVVEAGEDAVIY